ncbi:ABC transporter permease [Adhaeribacter soli]|uniref:ABC transporter permease n=1 Tax=Adhaeribacter soli TaxID=2607655 RepID=A0A5N1J4M3_9BACT|nr:ABC transporter permease [Adhaeribacter soli]KAA9345634.1 ABC transporter permease [Adhaeribacter soli]
MATLTKKQVVHSPGYYIRQRLLRNGPAMLGLALVMLAVLVALAGHLILPDPTPNANDGIVALQKKPAGFTVKILNLPKADKQPEVNFLERWLFGAPSAFESVPIESYKLENGFLVARPYRSGLEENTALLKFPLQRFFKEENASAGDQHISEAEVEEFIETRTYWLGTDKAGRDVLSRLLLGTRISLGIGFLAVLISVTIGLFAGALAGYLGGRTDKAIMFIMTVVWSVPGIMLVIAISLALGSKSVWVSFVAVGLTMWVDVARVVRGQILSLKEKTYIEAAKVTGLPELRIIVKHLLPNLLGPLIVTATANFASAILMEAGLSFLGLGVQPPAPSWGMMVNEGFQLIGSKNSLFLVLLPSICISLLVLAFNLLGNGLRDAYDPKIIVTNA